jgi:hypothetical protein
MHLRVYRKDKNNTMKYIQNLLNVSAIIAFSCILTFGQTEDQLKRYFEGKKVEVKIDLPATKDGVNVYPEKNQPVDYGHYAKLLKAYGISVKEGDRIMITKIKVKDKLIEFQLGGGGYGTFGDETSSDIYVPAASKSRREKNLEKQLKYENEERRRRRIKEELDYLRRERQREDNRNQAEVAEAEELAKQRIEEKRLMGGSRFNIRFERKVTSLDLTPEVIMEALEEYVEFSDFN